MRDETKPLVEFHLSTLALNAEFKSDNSLRAAAILKGFTVTDRRRGKEVGHTQ